VPGSDLETYVASLADELGIPGVAVGVIAGDEALVACHGVTSTENPLPVDESTLFQFGSTGKTFTAVALLRLVERGDVELDAPVRRYVPELRLQDAAVAEQVTVLQLLNHTAGWDGDFFADTGQGDDCLARYVERMAELEQVTPLGSVVSYNNAALALAGRVLERVTGTRFEDALQELVLDPAGLRETFFSPNDAMTRRFVVGHGRTPEGVTRVLRPWQMHRSAAPMGGMAASVRDQLAWARLHLDGGRASDGTQLLARELVARMQRPTVHCPGSGLGDAIGISWMLDELDGQRIVRHGGATLGQLSAFQLVPDRGFAIVSLTNCSPDGLLFNQRVAAWALETWLGLRAEPPVPAVPSPARLAELAGVYRTVAADVLVEDVGGRLEVRTRLSAQLLEQLGEDADAGDEPTWLDLVAGEGDRWVVTEGVEEGRSGAFIRDEDGRVVGLHAGGRYAPRLRGSS
jgi:CubicO group peptidase (beta-lactamase class C family)